MAAILLLVGVADATRTRSAVVEAVRLQQREGAYVHVLSVQPRVNGHVAMYFGASELHQMQQRAGDEDMADACKLLDLAGVRYSKRVMVGRSAETIALAARELACDRIVLGEEVGIGFAQKVFGSLAAQVRQLVAGGECVVIGS